MKTIYKRTLKILFTLVVISFLVSCSTKKNKWYTRAYHSTVAHYNAYWNGNDAFKQGIKTVNEAQKDDFSRILPVFKVGLNDNVATIKPNMERAIEKSSKVIKKHSMFIDQKERNPEIKKAYLLIGKSSFYKKDYKTATATFKYIINSYKDNDVAYEAMIWLAFTYCKTKEYSLSETTLDQVRNKIQDGKAPKSLNKFLYSVYAETAIDQKKYGKALEYIQLAKKNSWSRSFNTRLMFIEAQFYQQANELERASKLYGKTSSRATSFDMQFASKLFQAMCYDPKKGNSKKIISKLDDMAQEKKNEIYKDQIFYALAEIYYKDKNVDKACLYWEKSVNASFNNDNQKISSSLRYADVNYDLLEKYEQAQMYYDTALSVMKRDYPNYDKIKSKQIVLTNLVTNIRIVNRWDSLMAMSNLSLAELDTKIVEWISQYKKREEEKKKAEMLAKALSQRATTGNPYDQYQQQSSWYFYNNNTVQAGKTEYIRIWGNRKLEDNWRLSDKQQSFDLSELEDSTSSEDIDSLDTFGQPIKKPVITTQDPLSKDFYTKDIPRTQGQKDTANFEISKALLTIGYIYYQGLSNNGKAISTFLELQKRFPTYQTTLPSSYHLYRIYDKIGQTPNANYYKNKVLKEYPESEFAMMISNPDYWQELAKSNTKSERLYKNVYDTYSNNDYQSAIQLAKDAIDSLNFGPYIPRLLYIEALSKGKLHGIDSLMNYLNMIVFNYPSSEITPTIENQLKYLSSNYNIASKNLAYKPNEIKSKNNKETKETDNDESKEQINKKEVVENTIIDEDILDSESLIYRYRNMDHFYVILFDDDKINASELKVLFSDFNSKYYPSDNLKLTSLLFTMSQQMITVNKFEDIEKAMTYFNSIISTNEVLKDIDPSSFKHFIISSQNYPTFYNRKNIPAYLKFFRIFYLNPQKNNNK
ncbi:MAG: tol-pal system protein YbgF [Bacteroidetes bacterium]|nr:tol-pal system protein YbgF [Bacteroidota bacterium]